MKTSKVVLISLVAGFAFSATAAMAHHNRYGRDDFSLRRQTRRERRHRRQRQMRREMRRQMYRQRRRQQAMQCRRQSQMQSYAYAEAQRQAELRSLQVRQAQLQAQSAYNRTIVVGGNGFYNSNAAYGANVNGYSPHYSNTQSASTLDVRSRRSLR